MPGRWFGVLYPELQQPPVQPPVVVVGVPWQSQYPDQVPKYRPFLTGGGQGEAVAEVDDVLMTNWFQPLSTPVWQKKALRAGLQQALAFVPVVIVPETITLDKWYEQWPDQRPPKSRQAALRSSGFVDPTGGFIPPEVVTMDKWYTPPSEPKRFRLSFNAALQQFFWYDPTTPVTPPSPPPPPPPPVEPGKGGGKHPKPRRPSARTAIPQQVVDDVAALYQLVWQNRKQLDSANLTAVAALVGPFAETYDGRLPAPASVVWRDLVEYPDIDLSALTRAAEYIMALPAQPQDADFSGQPGWASAIQAGAVDRAFERLRRDAQAAAAAARAADEQDEEDALMALLLLL